MLYGIPQSAHAQVEGAGIKLVPATIERLASPGETIKETVTITNESSEEKQFFLFTKNIKGVENGGVPVFADDNLEPTGYEMTEWVKLDFDSIDMEPHEVRSFPVVITVPENASPGSHFGGLFVSVEPPRLREIGAGVGYQVASIFSIRIKGDIIDEARIRSFSTNKLFYGSKNVHFVARVENQGNILIRPRGPLTIQSMFGGDPDLLIVNDSQAGVFPGTVRDLEFDWKKEGLGFGRYEAVLALSYDGENGQKTINASLYFWVFPAKVIIPIMIAFLAVLIGGWLATRLYINRAITRASGSRRIAPARYRRQVGISRFAFVFVMLMGVIVLFLIMLLIFFA